jgi:hypothetical protein
MTRAAVPKAAISQNGTCSGLALLPHGIDGAPLSRLSNHELPPLIIARKGLRSIIAITLRRRKIHFIN